MKLNADTLATYFYDPNGNRIAVKTAAGTDSATYDEQDRLTSRGVMSSGYTRYTYSAAGELKSKTVGSAVTQYVYDPLGNLVSVTLPNGDLVTYSADGTGRRVGRRLNGSWTGGWVYRNGLNVVADLDGMGAVVNRYAYGLDDQVPALLLRGASTYRVITDQLGSVRGVVDVSSGAVMQQTDYDAWGVPTVVSGGSFQALGYAGGLTDASTGLVRFGARDYDPLAGRWTCKEPRVRQRLTTNLYAYAGDDPLQFVDPNGLIAFNIGCHTIDISLSASFVAFSVSYDLEEFKSSDFQLAYVFLPFTVGASIDITLDGPKSSHSYVQPYVGVGKNFSVSTFVASRRPNEPLAGDAQLQGLQVSIGPSEGLPVGVLASPHSLDFLRGPYSTPPRKP